ncbi:hypothetical protein [Actinoplanes friuliensis]|nr:hypothetical protein [Actinoplanes friuliensis]
MIDQDLAVFVPALPDPGTFGTAVPPLLDLVGRSLLDDADKAAVDAVTGASGSVALWRVWRLTPDSPPVRLYVLETAAAAPDGLDALVYRTGDEVPAELRRARNSGALLWTAADPAPLRVAPVFDSNAGFDPAHVRLDDPDRDRIADRLDGGSPILATADRLTDVVDPARGAVVPMSYRTDGRWIWTESVSYYLRTYGLAPGTEFLAHLRAAGRPATDAAGEHRALAALFQSAAAVRVQG